MMTLQIIATDKSLLEKIAEDLIESHLIANAIISQGDTYKTLVGSEIENQIIYTLKGISKSLLFSKINNRLRSQYGDQMPLLYSEPIIMIDAKQTEAIIEHLVAV